MDAKIFIPTPCHEDWNKMTPTEKGRFCAVCTKEVKDFRGMPKQEILNVLTQTEGEVCGNFNISQLDKDPADIKEIKTLKIPYYFRQVAMYVLALFGALTLSKSLKAQGKVGKVAPLRGKVAYNDWEYENTNQKEVIISGSVKNYRNEKIGGASIEIWSNNNIIASLKSIANGSFTYTLPPKASVNNKIKLRVVADLYEIKETEVIVDKEKVRVEINLGADYALKGEVVINVPDVYSMMGAVAYIPDEEISIIGDTVVVCENTNTGAVDSVSIEKLPDVELIEIKDDVQENQNSAYDDKTTELIMRDEDVNINIYPNPANNILTLELINIASGNIYVYDMNGKNIFQKTNTANKTEIDVSRFERGVYIIRVETDTNKNIEKKFIKQ